MCQKLCQLRLKGRWTVLHDLSVRNEEENKPEVLPRYSCGRLPNTRYFSQNLILIVQVARGVTTYQTKDLLLLWEHTDFWFMYFMQLATPPAACEQARTQQGIQRSRNQSPARGDAYAASSTWTRRRPVVFFSKHIIDICAGHLPCCCCCCCP